MAEDIYGGAGASGVPKGGQLEKDIINLSDQAKAAARVEATRKAAELANTKQNLSAALGGPGDIQSLHDRIGDGLMKDTEIDPNEDPRGYLNALSQRILEMEKLAKKASSTEGTGNRPAYRAYLQTAAILKDRLHSFQSKYAKQLEQEMDQGAAQHLLATSQPAGGQ